MNYHAGDIIEAKVSGLTHYGIFVRVGFNFSGLIHISEVSNHYVRNLWDYVEFGENILCEILEVESNNHLRLSIKNINYKLIPHYGTLKDTPVGFKSLQMHLPVWIREKKQELNIS